MMVLITYDVNTSSPQGVKRLARVAKICTNYGQRAVIRKSISVNLHEWQKYAQIMVSVCKILFLNALWIIHNLQW